MNKKLYWGLGVLFILIIGGFVFLIVQQKAELAKYEADYALPTEKVAENENNIKTPQNGHWHGNEWHNEPHDISDGQSVSAEPNISDGQSVSAEPILAPFYPTSDIQPDNWHSEFKKARDEWLQARETAHNFRKGKWTPEHIQALSDTEKQQIASQLRELTGHVETSKKKLDALFEVKKAYKK